MSSTAPALKVTAKATLRPSAVEESDPFPAATSVSRGGSPSSGAVARPGESSGSPGDGAFGSAPAGAVAACPEPGKDSGNGAPYLARCMRARCGRTLSDPRSIARGYGPRCYRRIQAAVRTLGASPSRAAHRAASLLLRPWAMTPTCVPGFYHITKYTTSEDECDCAAGEYDALCHHRVAVTLLVA